MANNFEEGQGLQRAVMPVMMMMMIYRPETSGAMKLRDIVTKNVFNVADCSVIFV
jgi:hypothetical protein